tara:strand:+ start:9620 stop:11299 length:1680 start_codon:yes stop_codon:yes gene_type:complete
MKIYKIRLFLLGFLIFSIFILFFVRCYYLFVTQKDFLQNQGDLRAVRVESIPNIRGSILDRNGKYLAVSTIVYDLWLNPYKIHKDKIDIKNLTKQLKTLNIIKPKKLDEILSEKEDKQFVYIKRNISPNKAEKIKQLNLPYLFLEPKTKRYYPSAEVVATLLGKTDIDDNGVEGIELYYNKSLKGTQGKQSVLKDRLGRTIKELDLIQEPLSGQDLTLSIDLRLQYLAYKELVNAIDYHNSQSGAVVILDVTTGEVLAMANYPSYNPNNSKNVDFNSLRNRAITDVFEPGSVFKPLTLAMAFENKNITQDDIIDTSPGFLTIKNKTIKDIRNFGKLTVRDILIRSSNIGISKLIADIDQNKFVDFLYNLGFTSKSQNELQGETSGWLNHFQETDKFSYYTLGFGYGIAVNALQLVKAYAAIGNKGYLPNISVLKQKNIGNIEYKNKIMSENTSSQVLDVLHGVTGPTGTARRAVIPFAQVAGKTGTTRRIIKGVGYDAKSHNAMFVGLAPYPNPKLAMVVFIADPKENGYYGGLVAAPVFSKVMSSAVRILGLEQQSIG